MFSKFALLGAAGITALGLAGCGTPNGPSPTPVVVGGAGDQPPVPSPQTVVDVPTPAPTPDYNAPILAYSSYISAEAPTLVADLTAVGTDATNGDTVSIVTDEQTLINDATQFRAHISGSDGLAVPPPLQHINGLLSSALSDFIQSGRDVIAGVNTNNVGDINAGTALIQTATSDLNEATSETQALTATLN